MFRNEYVTEREERQAVMEQHVTMTNSLTSLAERNGRGCYRIWLKKRGAKIREGVVNCFMSNGDGDSN